MHIIPATDMEIVRQILQMAALPYQDVDANTSAHFFLLQEEGCHTALVGLEVYGREAMLRSLVVLPEYRRTGRGARMLGHVRQAAAAAGATALYLLTTDSADYFRRHGFREVPRNRAPGCIRQTPEFTHLCPEHALLLCQRLLASAIL